MTFFSYISKTKATEKEPISTSKILFVKHHFYGIDSETVLFSFYACKLLFCNIFNCTLFLLYLNLAYLGQVTSKNDYFESEML